MTQVTQRDEMYSRFHDTISERDKAVRIVVFGCGAIGSYAALAIAKMGFQNINLLDHDDVELVNVGTQLFGAKSVGLTKVEATHNAIVDLVDGTMLPCRTQKFEYDITKDFIDLNDLCRNAILICAIDSMKARDYLFKLAPMMGAKHFIDGRMAIEFLDVYSVNLEHADSVNRYTKSLFSDDDAIPMPCTNKSIGYTAMIAGGVIGKMVKDVATGDQQGFQNFKFNITELGGECM